MAKRIKRVFGSADQVLHLWANQTQSDARSRNVFFHGRDVYSYGRHYRLGRIVEFRGKRVALINGDGYSVTTSKHISWAQSATSHLPTVVLKDFDWSWDVPRLIREGLTRQMNEIIESIERHFRSRKFYPRTERGESHWMGWKGSTYSDGARVKAHNELCDTLGMKSLRLDIGTDFIQDYNAHADLMIERKRERDAFNLTPYGIERLRIESERRQAALASKSSREIEAWKAGTGSRTEAVRSLEPQIIRVNGDQVETSRGAVVSLAEARKFLAIVERGSLKSGTQVGSYTYLKTVSDGIIQIGCHRISVEQAKSVLNVPKLTLVSANGEV
jgi:hypothetical protein